MDEPLDLQAMREGAEFHARIGHDKNASDVLRLLDRLEAAERALQDVPGLLYAGGQGRDIWETTHAAAIQAARTTTR